MATNSIETIFPGDRKNTDDNAIYNFDEHFQLMSLLKLFGKYYDMYKNQQKQQMRSQKDNVTASKPLSTIKE